MQEVTKLQISFLISILQLLLTYLYSIARSIYSDRPTTKSLPLSVLASAPIPCFVPEDYDILSARRAILRRANATIVEVLHWWIRI